MATAVMVDIRMRMLQTGRCMTVVVALQRDMHQVRMQRLAFAGSGLATFHRDSRERLNRKAQCQQDDDEKFAPVVHEGRV